MFSQKIVNVIVIIFKFRDAAFNVVKFINSKKEFRFLKKFHHK